MPLTTQQEEYLAYAKAKTAEVRVLYGTPEWKEKGVPIMRDCITYTDYSGVMLDSTRMEESLWILSEVQIFAFYDLASSPGIAEFSNWCEAQYEQMLCHNPYDAQAVNGTEHTLKRCCSTNTNSESFLALADIHRSRADHYLNQIQQEGGASADKVDSLTYMEARGALARSLEYQQRCVRNALHQAEIPMATKVDLIMKVLGPILGGFPLFNLTEKKLMSCKLQEVQTRFTLSGISSPSEYAVQAGIIAGVLQTARHNNLTGLTAELEG